MAVWFRFWCSTWPSADTSTNLRDKRIRRLRECSSIIWECSSILRHSHNLIHFLLNQCLCLPKAELNTKTKQKWPFCFVFGVQLDYSCRKKKWPTWRGKPCTSFWWPVAKIRCCRHFISTKNPKSSPLHLYHVHSWLKKKRAKKSQIFLLAICWQQ